MFLRFLRLANALLRVLSAMPDQSIRRTQDLLCYGETWIRIRRLPNGGLQAERVPAHRVTILREEKSGEKKQLSRFEYTPNLN